MIYKNVKSNDNDPAGKQTNKYVHRP